jgi:hypothetical protein
MEIQLGHDVVLETRYETILSQNPEIGKELPLLLRGPLRNSNFLSIEPVNEEPKGVRVHVIQGHGLCFPFQKTARKFCFEEGRIVADGIFVNAKLLLVGWYRPRTLTKEAGFLESN